MAWITLAISLTALAASAIAIVAARDRRRAHARLSRLLADTVQRLAAAVAELNDGLGRVSGETRFAVALGELTGAVDLEDALARIADAATLVAGAQSAVVRAVDGDGQVVVGATDPTPDVSFASELEWPPTGARAMTFTFLHDRGARGEPRAGSGLALPIGDDTGRPLALLSVLFDEAGHAARSVTELESLAARAAPVVAALLDTRAAQTPRDRDELTGLPAREAFHHALFHEATRARRHGAPLTVVVLDVDDMQGANERLGRAAADSAFVALARCVEAVLPAAAVACRVGGDELAVVLPATTRLDAEVFVAQIDAERAGRELSREITFTAGAAELMLTDDAVSVFERAAKSLQTARGRPPRGPGESVHGAHEQG